MNDLLDYILKLSKNDNKTLSQKALKTSEEVGELARVVLPYDNADGTTHRFVLKEQIFEEAIDTVLCALSIAYDLQYSHEDIFNKMMEKAQYWEKLQIKEKGITYPLPYEIHITVKDANLENFKTVCKNLNVKPLLIDMHNRTGQTVLMDMQTSSVHMGDNRSAAEETKRIAQGLIDSGFEVIREKVETVPWHPAAPVDSTEMPSGCYFEAHFNIVVDDEKREKLKVILSETDVHLSRNAFKKISDTEYVIMATLRVYKGSRDEFEKSLDDIVTVLKSLEFDVPKTITEFCVFDSKISHDAAWLV